MKRVTLNIAWIIVGIVGAVVILLSLGSALTLTSWKSGILAIILLSEIGAILRPDSLIPSIFSLATIAGWILAPTTHNLMTTLAIVLGLALQHYATAQLATLPYGTHAAGPAWRQHIQALAAAVTAPLVMCLIITLIIVGIPLRLPAAAAVVGLVAVGAGAAAAATKITKEFRFAAEVLRDLMDVSAEQCDIRARDEGNALHER